MATKIDKSKLWQHQVAQKLRNELPDYAEVVLTHFAVDSFTDEYPGEFKDTVEGDVYMPSGRLITTYELEPLVPIKTHAPGKLFFRFRIIVKAGKVTDLSFGSTASTVEVSIHSPQQFRELVEGMFSAKENP